MKTAMQTVRLCRRRGTHADGTFQDQLEAALGDQTPFAERFKARYNDLSSNVKVVPRC